MGRLSCCLLLPCSALAWGASTRLSAPCLSLSAPPPLQLPPACAPAAVRGLLLDSRRKAQPGSHASAVSEGLLAVRSSSDGGRHAAGLAAAAGQQAEVAMLCLERLVALGE